MTGEKQNENIHNEMTWHAVVYTQCTQIKLYIGLHAYIHLNYTSRTKTTFTRWAVPLGD